MYYNFITFIFKFVPIKFFLYAFITPFIFCINPFLSKFIFKYFNPLIIYKFHHLKSLKSLSDAHFNPLIIYKFHPRQNGTAKLTLDISIHSLYINFINKCKTMQLQTDNFNPLIIYKFHQQKYTNETHYFRTKLIYFRGYKSNIVFN